MLAVNSRSLKSPSFSHILFRISFAFSLNENHVTAESDPTLKPNMKATSQISIHLASHLNKKGKWEKQQEKLWEAISYQSHISQNFLVFSIRKIKTPVVNSSHHSYWHQFYSHQTLCNFAMIIWKSNEQ